ncbi:MAG: YfhO family protein [Anaerovoracaceae bacterium]
MKRLMANTEKKTTDGPVLLWLGGLELLTLFLLLLPAVCSGSFFGSEGDWYSQHVGAAELLRQTMLEQGTLFPQFVPAGGGSNLYDFAYYGFLRPDVVLSCLIPQVEMKYVIAGYSILEVLASGGICFFWLTSQNLSSRLSFCGGLLLVSAACFFHAHHQIMFVNYMPFLLLALMGVDRIVLQKGNSLLTVSLLMIALHSFYYLPVCLLVCGMYAAYRLASWEESRSENAAALLRKTVMQGLLAAVLAVAMAGVLLLPAALDILDGSKDAGSFRQIPLQPVDVTFKSLLYQPYGCGMTCFALLCLVSALVRRRDKLRFLAAAVLSCLMIPAVWLVLNGFLYARPKILIPLVPLIVFICCQQMKAFRLEESRRGRLLPLILIPAVLVSLLVNCSENWIPADDDRQNPAVLQQLETCISPEDAACYRMEILSDSLVNCNLPVSRGEGSRLQLLGRTAMYSSVSSSLYSRFYCDGIGNPISIQNRVALLPAENPVFLWFMGVQYLVTEVDQVPAGYRVMAEKNGKVLAENPEVLPVCYGASAPLAEKDEPEHFLEIFPWNTAEENMVSEKDGELLRIRMDVEQKDGKEVVISIGNIKNKLSGSNAPYPNGNSHFQFILAKEPGNMPEVKASGGRYSVSGVQIQTMDWEKRKKQIEEKYDITSAAPETYAPDGRTMFHGSVAMKKDGWLVTSFPYREGYAILADGKPLKVQKVNTAFAGAKLSAGVHHIEVRYEAPGFREGLAVSLAGTAAWIAITSGEWILRRKKGRK